MGQVKGCEACGADYWKHAADTYEGAELVCWECETGAFFEQNRIIELLRQNFNRFDLSNNQIDPMSLGEFIALIKGEQK